MHLITKDKLSIFNNKLALLINVKSENLAYWMLSLTAFFLACNHVIGRSVEGVIPPLGLSFWRWMAGALILLPLVMGRFKQSLPYYRSHFHVLLALGFMMVGSTTLVLVALNHTTAINTSLLNALQPAMTVLFAMIFLDERLSRLQWFGILIGLLGVTIMVTKADWQMLTGLQFNIGDLLVLLAVCGFAGYALTLRKLPPQLTDTERLFAIAMSGSLLLLPFYIWESVTMTTVPFTTHTIGVVLILALLVTVLGNAMWNRGIMIIGPSKATMFINLIPLFGAALAVSLLGESLRLYHLFGIILICLGIQCVIKRQ
jgi:drug/metabolite transporter (DMT)-like permease